jgi:hypothetical protein
MLFGRARSDASVLLGCATTMPSFQHNASITRVFLFATLLLASCGRQATEADCQLIIDRNVELEMKSLAITDQAAIAKRKEEIHSEMKGDLTGCVGKRVTNAMMACVQKAQSTDEMTQCMR